MPRISKAEAKDLIKQADELGLAYKNHEDGIRTMIELYPELSKKIIEYNNENPKE